MNLRGNIAWLVHGLFIVCAMLILGAMTALTRGVIATEREKARAEAKAEEQERMRLALWRMDAAAAAWIADEAQRPVMAEAPKDAAKPEVKLRFDAREDGALLADDPDRVPLLLRTLGLSPGDSAFPVVCTAMPELPGAWSSPQPAPEKEEIEQKALQPRASPVYQKIADEAEYGNRGRAVKGALDQSLRQFEANVAFNGDPGGWSLVRASLPRPARIGGELFLLRHLQWKRLDGSALRSIQGAWIDEAALESLLLEKIVDLFPHARLSTANSGDGASDGRALASFPWRLAPETGSLSVPPLPGAVTLPLAAGWIAAILALAAAWLLVGGLLRLSDRRASFVSAVTHELRTPLTTFQLYSEMLETGAVKEEKRGDYFRTLRGEAERLSHLVENVLAFSRIERGSARAAPGNHVAGGLIRPMGGRFAERLHEAGLRLAADWEDPAWNECVRADPVAVEHVLFNLIDNAAKYAAASSPPEVRLDAVRDGSALEIRVTDHGPGIAKGERRRIFRAFHKSAAAAAESRPGVGLGLALSRRLARAAGGDLVLRPMDRGSCFALRLPVRSRRPA